MGLEAQLRVLITSDGSSCRCDDGSGVILVGFWIILDPLYHYMDPLKFLQFEFAAVCCGLLRLTLPRAETKLLSPKTVHFGRGDKSV